MNRSLLLLLGLSISSPSLAQYTATQRAQFQDCVRVYSSLVDQESCFRRSSLLKGKTAAELVEELSDLASRAEQQRIDDERREEAAAERERNKTSACIESANLTSEEAALVYEKKIRIGMTEEGLLCSWGSPTRVNRTVNQSGVYKQYVYERNDAYVYVENGIVTSWQD